jgi:lantibiotic modifying enzyme
MRTLLRRLEKNGETVRYIGLHQGWGGVLNVLSHLGRWWNESEWLEAGERIVDLLRARVDRDLDLDVVVGSAGALLALLSFHRATGSEKALAGARQCGERLISEAIATSAGVAWRTPIGGEDLQTGYAHGAAGLSRPRLVALAAGHGRGALRAQRRSPPSTHDAHDTCGPVAAALVAPTPRPNTRRTTGRIFRRIARLL